MHELSLARSVEHIVTRAAGGRRVTVVEIVVGELRQVVPDTLRRCWDLTVETTDLAGAQLRVRSIPAVISCQECGATTRLAEVPIMRCATCGSQAVRLVSGEEFLVTTIELEVGDGTIPPA